VTTTSGGYTCLLRSRLDDPWLRDPTTPVHRAVAYWWLHRHAAWRSEIRIVKGTNISLQRGQLLISYSALATEWQWNVPAVQRLLATCAKKHWVRTEVTRGRMIITLLDYDAWRQVETAGDMAGDRELHIARDAGDTSPDTAAASYQSQKTADHKKPLRNEDTAGDTAFSKRYRNHDRHTDIVKEESSEEYKKESHNSSSADGCERETLGLRSPASAEASVGQRHIDEKSIVEAIVHAFDTALVDAFGPGQDTRGFPGNGATAARMWGIAAQAGLSPAETLDVAQKTFRTTLAHRRRDASPLDPTRGHLRSLAFFHGDRSPRWGRAIDGHLRARTALRDLNARPMPMGNECAPSRPFTAPPARRLDPFADLRARVESRRRPGVLIDAPFYEDVTK
jgi:hypothetical protein